jgi:hypothetical protein
MFGGPFFVLRIANKKAKNPFLSKNKYSKLLILRLYAPPSHITVMFFNIPYFFHLRDIRKRL